MARATHHRDSVKAELEQALEPQDKARSDDGEAPLSTLSSYKASGGLLAVEGKEEGASRGLLTVEGEE